MNDWQQQALDLLKTAEQHDDMSGTWELAFKALDVARNNADDGTDGLRRFPEGILGTDTFPDIDALVKAIEEARDEF